MHEDLISVALVKTYAIKSFFHTTDVSHVVLCSVFCQGCG